jgi:glucokinase
MRLIADIGGTNARFAMADSDGAIHARTQLAVSDHASFEDALRAYTAGISHQPTSAALSVAGPVIGNRVEMTNAPWTISERAVRAVCPAVPVAIVNDLCAVALAVPALDAKDTLVLHGGSPADLRAPVICINVGTGFGAAVAIPKTDDWSVLATEAGHMTLALTNAEERAYLGDASTIEEVFSGPGLHRLREKAALNGVSTCNFRQTYSRVLGRIAGDLALATGAWGGIALCGGVLNAFGKVVDLVSFLGGIHGRQGLASRLESIPVKRLICADPAFRGLTRLPL